MDGRHGTSTRSAARAGCECGCFAVGGGVDDGERCSVLSGGVEDVNEPGGLGGEHHGRLGLARVGPCGRARLGVEVDDDGGALGELRRHGEVQRERRFTRPAFFATPLRLPVWWDDAMLACHYAIGGLGRGVSEG